MELTHLAAARIQQHGIPFALVDAILPLGRRGQHDGAQPHFLDRKPRARMARAIGSQTYSDLERSLNRCLVVSVDGAIIAAAHRPSRPRS